ncbi:hypothetical protein CBX98_00235 [Vibrio sp. T9]|uniref:ADP-ribosyltransferase n=1 Tax=Vibrio sp. T9 TaxID=2007196 RepID=UPI000D642019|nr:ADP-ribosyltransferase [Vibrio sp. T9]PWF74121.1 hypothetical protein CBX98_00235 [Vibrio sp. T9]
MDMVLDSVLYNRIKKELESSPIAKTHSLDMNFKIAIRNYTSRRYDCINNAIRSENPSQKEQRAIALLDEALNSLPIYEGEWVYRYSCLTKELFESMTKAVGTDSIIYEEAFTSTSKSEFFKFEKKCDYYLKIRHKNGRRIDMFSVYPQEEEVLIPYGSFYKILSFDPDANTFVLEQLLEHEIDCD